MLAKGAADMPLAEILAHYAAHGWARLGKIATEEALAALCRRADDIMLGRVTYPGLFFQLDAETGRYEDLKFGEGYEGPSLEYRKIEKLEQDPLFRAWLENRLFERIARACVGDEAVAMYRAVLFAKGARGGSDLPWHQDAGRFWGLDRDPPLQIWTALDDVPRSSGCVEVVPGSHARGLATPLGGVVPAALVREQGAEAQALPLPAEAGEALLIHNYLWHRSAANATGRPRRAFTVCYMSADTRCMRTRRAPREFLKVWGPAATSRSG